MHDQAFLTRAAEIMREELFKPMGLDVPIRDIAYDPLLILFGWDGVTKHDEGQIRIMPGMDDLRTAAVLAHEMTHAALGYEVGHGPAFEHVTHAIGLEGPANSDHAGPGFIDFYNKHLKGLA